MKIRETRWVIINIETGAMPTGVNETFRRTAIQRFLGDYNYPVIGVDLPWREWRKRGYRAVKTIIEVEL